MCSQNERKFVRSTCHCSGFDGPIKKSSKIRGIPLVLYFDCITHCKAELNFS